MKRNEISKLIGARIREQRVRLGLSQEQLALEAEMHPSYFGCIERGEKCPTFETLYKICSALNISMSALFNDESESDAGRKNARLRIESAVADVPDDKLSEIAEIIERICRL